ncbi:hypothetical protein P8452_14876 [Trifolium repens]|nr:hypothetical protein QL285_010878 [Trifolium repens]WJX25887.1 hypothetical protein P8452_14876 [Trifolium repens]
MALSKKNIIVFGIVFTLLLYISSNSALASRQLRQLSEEDPCNSPIQRDIPGCSTPPSKISSHGFNDPPSEPTPCKGECPP